MNASTWTASRGVFISHSHRDNLCCRRLAADLVGCGFKVWYDEDDLNEGLLSYRIGEGLKHHNTFLPVVTPSYVSSATQWIELELGIAIDRYAHGLMNIVPVIAVGHADIPEMLRPFKCANFLDVPYQNGFQHLYRALAEPASATSQQAPLAPSVAEWESVNQSLNGGDQQSRLLAVQRILSLKQRYGYVAPGTIIDLETLMLSDPVRQVRQETAKVLRLIQE